MRPSLAVSRPPAMATTSCSGAFLSDCKGSLLPKIARADVIKVDATAHHSNMVDGRFVVCPPLSWTDANHRAPQCRTPVCNRH